MAREKGEVDSHHVVVEGEQKVRRRTKVRKYNKGKADQTFGQLRGQLRHLQKFIGEWINLVFSMILFQIKFYTTFEHILWFYFLKRY